MNFVDLNAVFANASVKGHAASSVVPGRRSWECEAKTDTVVLLTELWRWDSL